MHTYSCFERCWERGAMLMSNIHFGYGQLWICQRHHSSQQALWEHRQPLIGQSITTNPCATFSHRWDRGSHGSRSSQLWPQCSPASRCTESKQDGAEIKKGSLEPWAHIRYVCTYTYVCAHVHICISIYIYHGSLRRGLHGPRDRAGPLAKAMTDEA